MRFLLVSVLIILSGLTNHLYSEKDSGGNDIPELNKKIVAYVKTTINTQVGRGECWDLAAQALDRSNASWDHRYKYGREINPKKEIVYPGDIIQFENVVLKYKKGNRSAQETMEHHTAVVYEVKDQGVYVIAHQNTHFTGKKVGLSDLDLSTVVRGKLKFYRPVTD